MRDYLNEGGKAIVAGRNIHQWPTGGTGLTDHRPVRLGAGQAAGLLLSGRTTPATTTSRAPRSSATGTSPTTRGRTTSASSAAARARATARARTTGWRSPRSRGASSAAWRRSRRTRGSGNDPNEDANGINAPRAKSPTRLRNWSGISPQEPLRQEKIELDVSTAADAGRAGSPSRRRTRWCSGSASSRSRPRRATSWSRARCRTCCRPRRTPRRRPRSRSSGRRPTRSRRRRATRWRST